MYVLIWRKSLLGVVLSSELTFNICRDVTVSIDWIEELFFIRPTVTLFFPFMIYFCHWNKVNKIFFFHSNVHPIIICLRSNILAISEHFVVSSEITFCSSMLPFHMPFEYFGFS